MYKSADLAFSSHSHLISESCQDIFCLSGNKTAISSNMNKIIIGAFVAAILCEYYYINLKYYNSDLMSIARTKMANSLRQFTHKM